MRATIRGGSSRDTWVWDGKTLKPKYGATSKKTWEFKNGKLSLKYGRSSATTCHWDGEELKLGNGTRWIWEEKRQQLRPKRNPSLRDTWVFDGKRWQPKSGGSRRKWEVRGDIPVPVAAIVFLGWVDTVA